MMIAYCKPCKKVVAAGFTVPPSTDLTKPSKLIHHVVKGKEHATFVAESASEGMTAAERRRPQDFLDRLAKENSSLLK